VYRVDEQKKTKFHFKHFVLFFVNLLESIDVVRLCSKVPVVFLLSVARTRKKNESVWYSENCVNQKHENKILIDVREQHFGSSSYEFKKKNIFYFFNKLSVRRERAKKKEKNLIDCKVDKNIE